MRIPHGATNGYAGLTERRLLGNRSLGGSNMPWDVEYSPGGEGPGPGGEESLGLRDFWLYVWLRRAALVAAHASSAGLTVVFCVLSRPGTSLFSWHPVCMSIAYGVFMTQGVLLFHADGSPFCVCSRRVKARLHLLLHLLAAAFSAVGVGFMAASRSVSGLPHLSSGHALLGAATLAASGLQAADGLRLFLRPPAQPPASPWQRRAAGLPAGHGRRHGRRRLRLAAGRHDGAGPLGPAAAAARPPPWWP
ncbi:putative transmembrane reductase CYB561D1 [Menidia menidia]